MRRLTASSANGRLDEAPLVVALLRPGIREQDEDLVHGLRAICRLEDLDRVVTDDAHVRQSPLLEPEQAAGRRPDDAPRRPENPRAGMRGRERQQVVRVAEADLDDCRGASRRTAAATSSTCIPKATPYFGHSAWSARSCAAVIRPPRSRRSGSSVDVRCGHVWRGSYSAAGAALVV